MHFSVFRHGFICIAERGLTRSWRSGPYKEKGFCIALQQKICFLSLVHGGAEYAMVIPVARSLGMGYWPDASQRGEKSVSSSPCADRDSAKATTGVERGHQGQMGLGMGNGEIDGWPGLASGTWD